MFVCVRPIAPTLPQSSQEPATRVQEKNAVCRRGCRRHHCRRVFFFKIYFICLENRRRWRSARGKKQANSKFHCLSVLDICLLYPIKQNFLRQIFLDLDRYLGSSNSLVNIANINSISSQWTMVSSGKKSRRAIVWINITPCLFLPFFSSFSLSL